MDDPLDFKTFFEALPGSFMIFRPDAPHYTILAISDELLHTTSKQRKDVVGRSLFDVYPPNPDEVTATGPSLIKNSLDTVLRTKQVDHLPVVRYDVLNAEGVFEARYWSPLHKPILNKAGDVTYIIHAPVEVTDQIKAEKKGQELREIERTYNLLLQAPVAVFIVSGPEYMVELANEEMLKILDKTRDIVGKPFFNSIPELASQDFPQLLEEVRKTGESFHAREHPARQVINGKEELRYYNFIYHPYFANPADTMPSGVICVGHNVTEGVLAKRKLEESEIRFRSMIQQAPVAIGLTRGREGVYESINAPMLKLIGKSTEEELLGKKIIEIFPELAGQAVLETIMNVFDKGEPFNGAEVPVQLMKNGGLQLYYFNLSYTPLMEYEKITGVLHVAIDVTEQVETRHQLEENEGFIRSVVESAPYPIAVYIGGEMKIQLANQSIKDIWGKGNEVEGKLYTDIVPELEGQQVFKQIREVFASGRPFHAKNQCIDLLLDGKVQSFYFNYSFTPLFDAAGNVYGVMNTGVDVTDLNLARQAIEVSESRFRNMVQQAPVAILLLRSAELIIEVANHPMLQFMDKDETVTNKRLLDVLPELKGQPILDVIFKIFETGEPFTGLEIPVTVNVKGSSRLRYYNLSYTPLFEAGEVTGILEVATDVTEGVLARKELEVSQEELKLFKFMADQAHDTFLLVREDGSFAYMNPKALESLGYTREEAKHLRVSDIDPIYDEQMYSNIFALVQTDNIPQVKTLHKRKDGSVFPIEGTLSGLILNGEPHLFAIGRDVTERNKAEKAMEMKNAELIRTNNDLDNFIYTASHDLKAPISNIEALLQALLRTLPKESLQSQRAQRITSLMQESVDRFKKTIANLTEVVKLQKESNEEGVSVNLNVVIREVVLDLEPMIESSRALIEIHVEDNYKLYFSKKNLRSVLYNLLSNGIKYRSPSRLPRLEVSCKKLPDFHVLTISDNGLGLKEYQLEKLFSMFKRFHDHVEGTGIGLYMVKKMVENIGGHIEVESKEGIGTTFRVYFPHK